MSSTKPTGGPAFPHHGGWGDDPRNQIIGGGIDLRDYFAAKAIHGAADAMLGVGLDDQTGFAAALASSAYAIADAMLAAREEVKP